MPAHDDGAACADGRRTKTSKGGNRGKVTWREWRALHAPATRKGNVIHSAARKDSGHSASPMAIDIDQFGLRSACLFSRSIFVEGPACTLSAGGRHSCGARCNSSRWSRAGKPRERPAARLASPSGNPSRQRNREAAGHQQGPCGRPRRPRRTRLGVKFGRLGGIFTIPALPDACGKSRRP
jgi:hypothetical protein